MVTRRFRMFEFHHARKSMYYMSRAYVCWLFLMVCFTSESLVTLSNCSDSAINSSSSGALEDTSTDARFLYVESTTSDTSDWGHKVRCTEEERQRVGCHQGNCFAVDLNPRTAGCACYSGWVGERCELIEIPPDFWYASTVVGLVVGLIAGVAVVVISLLIFFIKRRQNKRRSLELNNGQDLRTERNSLGEEEEGTKIPLKQATGR